jgi:DNA-binding HxlR family transcriptional regulator
MKDHSKESCPVAKVATLLSDAWTMLVLRDLMKKPMRYSELHESLDGISTRTLSLKLEKLLDGGIITKKDPYYSVTTKGKKLGAIFAEMTKYGKKYLRV